MKSVKIAVVACLLIAATAAYAQNEAPAANVPQNVAQSTRAQAETSARHEMAKPEKQEDCVGPASFCNIYFGS